MTTKYRDFDEAASALDEVTFKVAGKTYSVPPDPPMAMVLRFTRMDWAEVTIHQVVEFLVGCFGQATIDQMSADGVGFVTFCKIASWLLDVYGLGGGLNAPVGNGAAPDPKAPRRVRRAKPATAKPKRAPGSVSPRPRSSSAGS